KCARDDTKGWEIIPPRIDVGEVECAMLAHPTKLWRIDTDLFTAHRYGYGANMSPHRQVFALAQSQHHIVDPANFCRALNNGIQHRLNVRRRATYDAEYL